MHPLQVLLLVLGNTYRIVVAFRKVGDKRARILFGGHFCPVDVFEPWVIFYLVDAL